MNKVKRKIIKIDENSCNGCGECIPACPEQALQLVDTPDGKKARLVKEFYCDGLGACLGNCPTGALSIVEEEVEPYDDKATVERIKKVAPDMLNTHIKHMHEHAADMHVQHAQAMPRGECGCPSAKVIEWKEEAPDTPATRAVSELRQWPVQIHLVPPTAPYLKNADITIIADCVPFAYPNMHHDFMKGKVVLVGCPKLDDAEYYVDKIAQIIEKAEPKRITIVHMEVPCCFGMVNIVEQAMQKAGKDIPFNNVMVGIKGEIKQQV
jgi:Pyruvate/2-oxoacid:ferredoxin oxidoreductase delta subunit